MPKSVDKILSRLFDADFDRVKNTSALNRPEDVDSVHKELEEAITLDKKNNDKKLKFKEKNREKTSLFDSMNAVLLKTNSHHDEDDQSKIPDLAVSHRRDLRVRYASHSGSNGGLAGKLGLSQRALQVQTQNHFKRGVEKNDAVKKTERIFKFNQRFLGGIGSEGILKLSNPNYKRAVTLTSGDNSGKMAPVQHFAVDNWEYMLSGSPSDNLDNDDIVRMLVQEARHEGTVRYLTPGEKKHKTKILHVSMKPEDNGEMMNILNYMINTQAEVEIGKAKNKKKWKIRKVDNAIKNIEGLDINQFEFYVEDGSEDPIQYIYAHFNKDFRYLDNQPFAYHQKQFEPLVKLYNNPIVNKGKETLVYVNCQAGANRSQMALAEHKINIMVKNALEEYLDGQTPTQANLEDFYKHMCENIPDIVLHNMTIVGLNTSTPKFSQVENLKVGAEVAIFEALKEKAIENGVDFTIQNRVKPSRFEENDIERSQAKAHRKYAAKALKRLGDDVEDKIEEARDEVERIVSKMIELENNQDISSEERQKRRKEMESEKTDAQQLVGYILQSWPDVQKEYRDDIAQAIIFYEDSSLNVERFDDTTRKEMDALGKQLQKIHESLEQSDKSKVYKLVAEERNRRSNKQASSVSPVVNSERSRHLTRKSMAELRSVILEKPSEEKSQQEKIIEQNQIIDSVVDKAKADGCVYTLVGDAARKDKNGNDIYLWDHPEHKGDKDYQITYVVNADKGTMKVSYGKLASAMVMQKATEKSDASIVSLEKGKLVEWQSEVSKNVKVKKSELEKSAPQRAIGKFTRLVSGKDDKARQH